MQDHRSDYARGLDLAASNTHMSQFDSHELREGYIAGLKILSGFTRDTDQLRRALQLIGDFPSMSFLALEDANNLQLIGSSLTQLTRYIDVAKVVLERVQRNQLIKLGEIV